MGDEKKTEDFASGPAVTAPDGRKGNCPRRDMASPGPAKPAGALQASVKPGSPAADAQKRKAYRRLPGQFRTAFLGVCVLLILFSAGTAAFLSGWWGMGSMACFAAAGWIVYKPETHYRLWRFRLDDQGKPAPAGHFQLCSIVVLLIAAGFVLLFLGILKH